ncbi:hypothetical protein ACTOB_004724 [Actinoplanes oblitus]|uniref:Uncharacterized protein n=1 Tax=Actinoplanes oblitus TaxID=3040509 RepID=A0ABY8W4J2_9ACTN|nr:hypothetical protein [Actinoplanes oblitus]WIM92769.1 hypothetical protein ACTOB_004724 [Actinoplanes oblitus]
MAALFFNTREFDLSDALGSIGELKNVIANELRQAGFSDVVTNQFEVAGNHSGGIRLSVAHLPVGGRRFWQVVMAGGDGGDLTLRTVNDIANRIQHLHFL